MLTQAQIDAGNTRLQAGKLKAVDVDKMIRVFRLFFTDLEQKYSYNFSKIADLDDTANTGQQAAQVAACMNVMETLGFGVAGMQGGRDGISYKEKDEYIQYVLIAFSQIYPIPVEFGAYSWGRHISGSRMTSTVRTIRRFR